MKWVVKIMQWYNNAITRDEEYLVIHPKRPIQDSPVKFDENEEKELIDLEQSMEKDNN